MNGKHFKHARREHSQCKMDHAKIGFLLNRTPAVCVCVFVCATENFNETNYILILPISKWLIWIQFISVDFFSYHNRKLRIMLFDAE